jgi:MFS family permease
MELTTRQMEAFHIELLAVATALHLATSILMGLLYGAMLPMFPRRPILLGGIIAPLMWSGLLYATMGIINPLLALRIDWKWFVASQIAFGVVAGLIVVRQSKVRTQQFMPFAVRAGLEMPGVMHERKDQGQQE